MPMVRASCTSCGDVEMDAGEVRVVISRATGDAAYSFQCPVCRFIVSKPAETRVVDLLQSAGVPVKVWDSPAELCEAKIGPPITHDDLLTFHFQVQQAGWLDELISRSTRSG
jgi:hypothetical protein